MLIGFDLDDTLAVTAAAVLAKINDALGTSVTIDQMVSPKWEDIIPEVTFPLIKGIFAEGIFSTLQPIAGAVDFTQKLVAEGHTLVIITDRFWNANDLDVTLEWLKAHGFPTMQVYLAKSGEKATLCKELGVEVMFEDRTANAVSISEVAKVYLIDHPSNLRDDATGVVRFTDYASFTW
jgi:uncharacterized HAD superfamily protein